MLKAITAFLYLGDPECTFETTGEQHEWLLTFVSQQEITEACDELRKEMSVLGIPGIVNRYMALESVRLDQGHDEAAEVDPVEEVSVPECDASEDDSFQELQELITTYCRDESAFGKQVNRDNTLFQRDLHHSYPNLNIDTVVGYKKNGIRHSFLEEY